MKKISIINYSLNHPKLIILFMVIGVLFFGMFFPKVKVDTDPENMLSKKETVRVIHNKLKEEFNLSDIIVLGIVNEENENGVFNTESLLNIYELTEYAKTLVWDDNKGVIVKDILSPSTVDNIKTSGLGEVSFSWLMRAPPTTQKQALEIRDSMKRLPFLNGTLLSDNGKAICVYLPITSKDMTYKVYSKLREKIAKIKGNDKFFITGLPVAEDTFGVEMFKQMAISAPLAMFIIFLLMLFFFKSFILVISPMIIAFVSVIFTMGFLIGTGNTVHIMSSMIPIFIMPIAVLDSIHILSEFFEKYPFIKDRRKTMIEVMQELFMPMLYTSLTSAVGFASLALTPIPPVQTFGLFVAFGIMIAWLLTITFIPAYIMLIKQKSLENFGIKVCKETKEHLSLMAKFLMKFERFTFNKSKLIMVFIGVFISIAFYGIKQIQINDNPIKWFRPSHPIRQADKVLNKHFAGTYMGYLALEPVLIEKSEQELFKVFLDKIDNQKEKLKEFSGVSDEIFNNVVLSLKKLKFADIKLFLQKEISESSLDERIFLCEEIDYILEEIKDEKEVFKNPDMLNYVSDLQQALLKTGFVGKSNSLVDIVKTIHRELFLGKEEAYKVPDSKKAVAQCIITYQNSHRPYDLWHFTNYDYNKINLWIQLKSGNNKDMSKLVKFVDVYLKKNNPPVPLKHNWFGLTYVNVVWQDKMVKGMLQAFLGSFLIVFLMMSYLFRSVLWGFLCMIPLSVTIAFIYGAVGIIGKDYDMPIAVLSSLTLGLAVDFAIHFLARAREFYNKQGEWSLVSKSVFEEPARAILRNVIVVSVGFIPLLAAPLMPYRTVGVFLAVILAVSGISTLVVLPAFMKIFEKYFFKKHDYSKCNCITCLVMSIALFVFIGINLHQYLSLNFGLILKYLVPVGVVLVPVFCFLMKKRCMVKGETNK